MSTVPYNHFSNLLLWKKKKNLKNNELKILIEKKNIKGLALKSDGSK